MRFGILEIDFFVVSISTFRILVKDIFENALFPFFSTSWDFKIDKSQCFEILADPRRPPLPPRRPTSPPHPFPTPPEE